MARRGNRRISKPNKSSKSIKPQCAAATSKLVADQGADRPTPEMLARVDYQFGPVKTEMNVQIGSAYRRRPLYLTMATKPGRFTLDQLSALDTYRRVFDRCDRSPFSSCLAAEQGGARGVGPASFIHASPAIIEAKRKLSLIERWLGIYRSTMRAVVLDDQSFSTIAMTRYGYRSRSWILVNDPIMKDGKQLVIAGKPQFRKAHREDIVPRSGRDREKIAHEFNEGLKLLTLAVERLGSADIDELWVHPRDDGSAIIHRASCAPNGTFRMWGSSSHVRQVLDMLLEANDDKLVYATPEEARDALLKADAGRLHQLMPEELAA